MGIHQIIEIKCSLRLISSILNHSKKICLFQELHHKFIISMSSHAFELKYLIFATRITKKSCQLKQSLGYNTFPSKEIKHLVCKWNKAHCYWIKREAKMPSAMRNFKSLIKAHTRRKEIELRVSFVGTHCHLGMVNHQVAFGRRENEIRRNQWR